MRNARLIALLAAALALGGCGAIRDLFRGDPDDNPQAYFERADEYFADEDYGSAVEYYEKVITLFPYSKYATLAELKTGEAYFLDERYPEALAHLEEFERRHPRHEDVEYVLYLQAMSHFQQIPTIDRTPVFAEKAVAAFDRLLGRFPEGKYAEQARVDRKEAQDWIARHILEVGAYYYRQGDYWASWGRCMMVLDGFRETEQADRALYYLGKTYFFLDENDKAEEVFEDHLAHFPQSPYQERVEEYLADLRGEGFSINKTYRRFKERTLFYFGYE